MKRTFEDQDGQPWLHVVYGTSQDVGDGFGTFKIKGYDVGYLGLTKDPTTFCLWRIAEVPYASEFFPAYVGATPTAYPMHPSMAHRFSTEAAYYEHQMQPKVNQEPRNATDEAAE